MANTEIPKQHDMFSGELVDTRSSRQKQQDREQALPQPVEMFKQSEIAQFGVNARPLLPISDKTRLALIAEETRTEEQIEADIQRAAEERTGHLFPETAEPSPEDLDEDERILYQQAQAIGLPFSLF